MNDFVIRQIKFAIESPFNNIAGMPDGATKNELIDLYVSYADKLKAMRTDGEPAEYNTLLNYLYRDASNYKTWNTVILKGMMTKDMFSEIQKCCEDGYEMFIPRQVGLDLLRDWSVTEDDGPYAELEDYELVTDEPTTDMTVEELLEKFREAEDNWKPEEYMPEIEHNDDNDEEDEDNDEE